MRTANHTHSSPCLYPYPGSYPNAAGEGRQFGNNFMQFIMSAEPQHTTKRNQFALATNYQYSTSWAAWARICLANISRKCRQSTIGKYSNRVYVLYSIYIYIFWIQLLVHQADHSQFIELQLVDRLFLLLFISDIWVLWELNISETYQCLCIPHIFNLWFKRKFIFVIIQLLTQYRGLEHYSIMLILDQNHILMLCELIIRYIYILNIYLI